MATLPFRLLKTLSNDSLPTVGRFSTSIMVTALSKPLQTPSLRRRRRRTSLLLSASVPSSATAPLYKGLMVSTVPVRQLVCSSLFPKLNPSQLSRLMISSNLNRSGASPRRSFSSLPKYRRPTTSSAKGVPGSNRIGTNSLRRMGRGILQNTLNSPAVSPVNYLMVGSKPCLCTSLLTRLSPRAS